MLKNNKIKLYKICEIYKNKKQKYKNKIIKVK